MQTAAAAFVCAQSAVMLCLRSQNSSTVGMPNSHGGSLLSIQMTCNMVSAAHHQAPVLAPYLVRTELSGEAMQVLAQCLQHSSVC